VPSNDCGAWTKAAWLLLSRTGRKREKKSATGCWSASKTATWVASSPIAARASLSAAAFEPRLAKRR
jgi:hypothetical protein